METRNRVEKYVSGVISGEIVASKWVIKACERYLKDLETGPNRGITFDEKAANHVIEFFETYLHHTTGRWSGQRFVLSNWQAFILYNVFGFKRDDGSRRFRTSFISVARKQGKSCLAAGVGNYCLIADGEGRPSIYSAATKKDQARIVFSEAKRQIKSSADLKRFTKVLQHNISVPETYGKFEALGADSDTLDGLNISCAILDEVHAMKDRTLWDVLGSATGSRRQPLIFAITTAGFDQSEASICWTQQEYCQQVLDNLIEDDSYFAFIATLDEGDDWQDEKNYLKSNPNLGISVQIEDLREESERVKKSPTSLNPFLRYKMNMWTSSEKGWLTADQWNICNKGEIDLSDLEDRPCYMGMDLSKKTDTSAIVLAFPPEVAGDDYIVLPFIFLPGETLAERERTERIPWLDWKNRELIHCTDGKVIQMDEILEVIKMLDARFDIRDIMYDRWRAPEILPQLEDMGWCADPAQINAKRFLIEFGQGFKDMSPAARNMEEIILAGQLNHGGHEALAWQISCVAMSEDDAGNIKFSKKKSKGKIDAVVSMAMALYRARVHPAQDDDDYNSGKDIFYVGDDDDLFLAGRGQHKQQWEF